MRDYHEMSFQEIREECEREALAELNQFAEEERQIELTFSAAQGNHIFDIGCRPSYEVGTIISVYRDYGDKDVFIANHTLNIARCYGSITELLDDLLKETENWNYDFNFDRTMKTFDQYALWMKEIVEWQITRSWRELNDPDRNKQ